MPPLPPQNAIHRPIHNQYNENKMTHKRPGKRAKIDRIIRLTIRNAINAVEPSPNGLARIAQRIKKGKLNGYVRGI